MESQQLSQYSHISHFERSPAMAANACSLGIVLSFNSQDGHQAN